MALRFVIQFTEFLIFVRADWFDADCWTFNLSIICRLSKTWAINPRSGRLHMLNFGDFAVLRGRTTTRCVGLVGFHEDTGILQVEDQSEVLEDRVSTRRPSIIS